MCHLSETPATGPTSPAPHDAATRAGSCAAVPPGGQIAVLLPCLSVAHCVPFQPGKHAHRWVVLDQQPLRLQEEGGALHCAGDLQADFK